MHTTQLKQLLNSLSLKEKIGQLVQLSGDFFVEEAAMAVGPSEKLGIDPDFIPLVGSVLNVISKDKVREIQVNYLAQSRHKIPLLFMGDVVYGYRTVFPIPLGLGATWNPALIEQAYGILSQEAFQQGAHVTYAPMVDLVRDPRWGRVLESTGEDPYLNSQFAQHMVKGIQGDLNALEGIAACVKHFAAYGAAEGGRDYNTVDMSPRHLREYYLPAYKAAIEAGVSMVMTSFNTVDGIPSTGNKALMKDLLRDEWGFDGVVVADYAAVKELVDHGVAKDASEATRMALEATVDIDMKTNFYANEIEKLVADGAISEALIDEAVWRVLTLKNTLGLFENPYRGISDEAVSDTIPESSRAIAKQVASEALVLLKNDGEILPLDTTQKIALIGPYADSKEMMGLWAVYGKQEDCTTLREAFEAHEGYDIRYAQGTAILEDISELGAFGVHIFGNAVPSAAEKERAFEEAIAVAEQSDVVVLALGEHTLQSGEAGSRTELFLPANQLALLDAIAQLGKPIVLVVFSGRPLVLTAIEEKVDAIITAWFPGIEGGTALRDVLIGDTNPSGKLSMSFPYSVGQIPIYYNHYSTGRPLESSNHSARFMSRYLDAPNVPLYPFGYGLSYSHFDYQNLVVDSHHLRKGQSLQLSVDVLNTSDRDGYETVQLYIRDLVGSVVRPVKELKGFDKVWIPAGEQVTVTFTIDETMLRFHHQDLMFESEPGEFTLMVGGNSQDVLAVTIELLAE